MEFTNLPGWRKKQRGFTLVELLVVVSAIGVLSMLAVPQYQRMRTKARQAEAKTMLSSLFAAEKAFNTEWGGYASNFQDLGFAVAGTMRYVVGFHSSINFCANGYSIAHGGNGISCPGGAGKNNTFDYCQTSGGACTVVDTASPFSSSTGSSGSTSNSEAGRIANSSFVAADSFRAKAYTTALKTPGGLSRDLWTINEAKQLRQWETPYDSAPMVITGGQPVSPDYKR